MNVIEAAKAAGAVFNVLAMGRHDGVLFSTAELERFAQIIRNQTLEEAANAVDAMKAPDGYGIQEQSLYDVATMEAADVVRALKGAKE